MNVGELVMSLTVIRYSVETGRRIISREELEELFKGDNVSKKIKILCTKGVLKPIIRGRLYYVVDYNERKLGITAPKLKLFAEALNRSGVKWYLTGMSALSLRGVTWEHSREIWIFNDRFRHRVKNSFIGIPVHFFKPPRKLLHFGIEEKGELKIASVEKAVLDYLYVSLPPTISNPREWTGIVLGLIKPCNKEKLLEYLKYYPSNVKEVVKAAINRSYT